MGKAENHQQLKEERKQDLLLPFQTSVIISNRYAMALSNRHLNVGSWILSPCVIVSAAPCQSKTYQPTSATSTHPCHTLVTQDHDMCWDGGTGPHHLSTKAKAVGWHNLPAGTLQAPTGVGSSPTCAHALQLLVYKYNSLVASECIHSLEKPKYA